MCPFCTLNTLYAPHCDEQENPIQFKADTPIADSLSCASPRCARLMRQVGSLGLQGYGAALPR
jgi:hypothetical protein